MPAGQFPGLHKAFLLPTNVMLPEHSLDTMPARVSILGRARCVSFVIKKTPRGYHHFVKVKGRWQSIPGMYFHLHVPNGAQAELRIFTYDPVRGCWNERRGATILWAPETN